MADTYIPSGEESAQEQQFLQALVGQIQSKENSAVPKYATQLYCNFGGRYDTLAVNTAMLNATVGLSYPGLTNYQGFFIAPGLTGSTVTVPPSNTLGGLTASGTLNNGTTVKGCFFTPQPNYQPGTLNWGWNDYPVAPSLIISQPPPGFPSPPQPGGWLPNLAFYRQSFLPCPFYIFMPKWMRSFTVGMRLYDNLGVLQPILIASKNNAKWQDATINSGSAPDGSYLIENLTPQQFQDSVPSPFFYISGTMIGGFGGLSSQFETTRKYFIVNSFNENPSGGSSIITASLSNYRNIGIVPAYNFLSNTYAVEHWTTSASFDGSGATLLPPKYPTPSVPDVSDYPRPNQTYQFSLPAPPSLPFRRYFRFVVFTPPNPAGLVFTATFSVNYPATYPNDPATFTVEPASFDIAKVTIANYSAVNPQPAGFPTPPVGVPTFNSLTLATMPLIGVDITAPL